MLAFAGEDLPRHLPKGFGRGSGRRRSNHQANGGRRQRNGRAHDTRDLPRTRCRDEMRIRRKADAKFLWSSASFIVTHRSSEPGGHHTSPIPYGLVRYTATCSHPSICCLGRYSALCVTKMKHMTWVALWVGIALPSAVHGQRSALDYFNQSRAKSSQGDKDGALTDIDRAIRLDSTFALAHSFRGVLRSDKGDLSGALADHTRAIRLAPRYAMATGTALGPLQSMLFYFRGEVKVKLSDFSGALADYNQSIRLDGEAPHAYYSRASVRRAAFDLHGALVDYDLVIALDPTFAAGWYSRAIVKFEMGDDIGGLADYKKAIQISPALASPQLTAVESRPDSSLSRVATSARPRSPDSTRGTLTRQDIDGQISSARSMVAKGDCNGPATIVNNVLGFEGVADTQKAQVIQIAADCFLEGRSYEGAKLGFELILNLSGASELDKKRARAGIAMANGYLMFARQSKAPH